MESLYDALGLEKSATTEDVRRGFRRAAKRAHPDTGGTREKFALVKTAVDVLSDPERRRKYDETGKIEEPSPDQTAQKAMNLACGAVEQIISVVSGKNNPMEFDIIKDATHDLKETCARIKREITNISKTVDFRRKLAKRFVAKQGKPNVLTTMIEFQTNQMQERIERLENDLKVTNMAMAIVSDHRFEVEPVMRQQAGFFQIESRWGGT